MIDAIERDPASGASRDVKDNWSAPLLLLRFFSAEPATDCLCRKWESGFGLRVDGVAISASLSGAKGRVMNNKEKREYHVPFQHVAA